MWDCCVQSSNPICNQILNMIQSISLFRCQVCSNGQGPITSRYHLILLPLKGWEWIGLTFAIMNQVLICLPPTIHHQMDYMFNLAWAFNQPVNLDTVKVARVREYLCLDFNCNYKPVTDCTVTRLIIRWTSCFGVHQPSINLYCLILQR